MTPNHCDPSRRVVAMAASVGGLNALSVILADLPANFKAAITIVMHVSPDHKSLLAEILKSRTRLQVKQAEPGDVDFILPLDKIASKLIELVGDGKNLRKAG